MSAIQYFTLTIISFVFRVCVCGRFFLFFPLKDPSFEQRVAEIHQGIRGQTTAEAEFNFLRYAKQLEFYGVEQYPAHDDRGINISLGVCAHGLVIFKDNLKFGSHAWLVSSWTKVV